MTTNDKFQSDIWRNIGTIDLRRDDLRATEALVGQGGDSGGAPSNSAPAASANTSNGDTTSERMTARVAEVFDRFGEAVVADITNAARRTAMLRGASAKAPKSSEAARTGSTSHKDAVDVDFVEVEPGKPSDA